MDERIKVFAHNLIHKSIQVKSGDKVYIDYTGESTEALARQLIKETYAAGAMPFPHYTNPRVHREMLLHCNEEQLLPDGPRSLLQKWLRWTVILLFAAPIIFPKIQMFRPKIWPSMNVSTAHRSSEIRVPKLRWCVMRYPNNSMAQLNNQSLEAFEDFYFDVCCLDYEKMGEAMTPLIELMNKTDKVRIEGPGTDLTFSIKGIPAIKCSGNMNIPDGEVYTAPVKDSINGALTYNTPAVFQGFTFENICFTFENGKIVKATANDTARINQVLDTDDGARYVGEFALGVNPYILNPMKDTLFDEKIMGSFHFTPGNCYDDAPNGNHSAIHWDLVCIQRPEYGRRPYLV